MQKLIDTLWKSVPALLFGAIGWSVALEIRTQHADWERAQMREHIRENARPVELNRRLEQLERWFQMIDERTRTIERSQSRVEAILKQP